MGFSRVTATALGLLLPLVATAITVDDPKVTLPSYPLRDEPTARSVALGDVASALAALRDAAATRDLGRFRTTLNAAMALADTLPIGEQRNDLRRALLVYRDVEQVWSFAEADRFGAFYDDQSLPGFHDHLTADYPAYESYMTDYHVTGRGGQPFYATAETRVFLLAQIAAARQTPALRESPVKSATPRPRRAKARPARVVKVVKAVALAPPLPLPSDALLADIHNAASPAVARPVEARMVDPTGGRGLVFIVLALIGIGILTTLARTDREVEPSHSEPLLLPPVEEPEPKKHTA